MQDGYPHCRGRGSVIGQGKNELEPTFPSFLPDVLCDPTDLIWKEGTPFEAMTDHSVFIDCVLAEDFRGFPLV